MSIHHALECSCLLIPSREIECFLIDFSKDLSISELVDEIHADDEAEAMLDSINWLARIRESFNDSEPSQEESSSSPSQKSLPLVPFTENQETAIVNPIFRSLLKAIGLQQPSSDQIFWRIPTSLSRETLDSVVSQVKSRSGGGGGDQQQQQQPQSNLLKTSSNADDIAAAIANNLADTSVVTEAQFGNEDDESSDDDEMVTVTKRRRVAAFDDDDD